MRILLDGMGGDNAPQETVKGAVLASKEISDQIVIIGDREQIEKELSNYKYDPEKIEIRHASEVITGEDSPVKSPRGCGLIRHSAGLKRHRSLDISILRMSS